MSRLFFIITLLIIFLGVNSRGHQGSKEPSFWSRLKAAESPNIALFDFAEDFEDAMSPIAEFLEDTIEQKSIQGPALSRFYYIVGLQYHGRSSLLRKAISREYQIVAEDEPLMSPNVATEGSCTTCGPENLVIVKNEQDLGETNPLIGYAETREYQIVGDGEPLDVNTTRETKPVNYYPNIAHAQTRLYRIVAEKAKPLLGHAETRTYTIVGEGNPIDAKVAAGGQSTKKSSGEEQISKYGYAVSRAYEIVGDGEPLYSKLKRWNDVETTTGTLAPSLRLKSNKTPKKSQGGKTLKFLSKLANSMKQQRNNVVKTKKKKVPTATLR